MIEEVADLMETYGTSRSEIQGTHSREEMLDQARNMGLQSGII